MPAKSHRDSRLTRADLWLERATGIEPAFSAWEADVLPLYDARWLVAFLSNGSPVPTGRAPAGARTIILGIRALRVLIAIGWGADSVNVHPV
jgi:hypothetical protein